MPIPWRRALGPIAAILVGTRTLGAQASPYVPLDDPRLPLLEHLIARGDVEDPSPMVRPFRRADAARVLAAADSGAGPSSALIHRLRAAFTDRTEPERWGIEARGGAQAYSHPRREVLHPAGSDGIRPYGDVRAEAVFGPIALVARPAAEPRLTDDPDWPGRHDLAFITRMVEAYASVQFKYGSVFYGQMDRNWGPVGLPGIGVSDYGYGRVHLGFDLGAGAFRLAGYASDLKSDTLLTGERINKYFFFHRLGVRLSDRLSLGLWETTVLAGEGRAFDGRYRNPLSLLLFANQYGLGPDGNVLIGLDAHWKIGRRITFDGQLALDDFQYEDNLAGGRYPNRWALTLSAYGPLGRGLAWRGLYTQASSLAFRTLDSLESFTEAGVGLGRNFADMDQTTFTVTIPTFDTWLLSPELTLLRQGEGRITDPVPPSDVGGEFPQIFIGTVERTWRVALGMSGRRGPLDLQANAGFHHVDNAGNVAGASADRFEGRLQATLGFRLRGPL